MTSLSKPRIDVRDNTTIVIIRCCHFKKNAHSKYERCNLDSVHLACKNGAIFVLY